MLALSDGDLVDLVDPEALLEVVSAAFKEVASGEATMPLRTVVEIPALHGYLLSMPVFLARSGVLTAKIMARFEPAEQGARPNIGGAVLLFENGTARVAALLDGPAVTRMRTAVASALSCRVLARAGARVLAVIGSGPQAAEHIRVFAALLELDEIRVCARSYESAEALTKRLSRALHPNIRAVSRPEECVRGADIVLAASTATTAVVRLEWLRTGTHICAIGATGPGRRELDTATMAAAQVVAVDTRAGCLVEAEDIVVPVREGVLARDRISELGEILVGRRPGRSSPADLTVYKSVGVAALDAATAALAYRRAVELGRGTHVTGFNGGGAPKG